MKGPMDAEDTPRYLGVAAISASVIALQVVFTRIFSIVVWHHFTYLIIGLAMLGGGAAGTFLAVRRLEASRLRPRLGAIAVAFSASVLASVVVLALVRFDPLSRGDLVRTLIGLAVYFSSLFATFFLGSLAIAGSFLVWARRAHRLYFADLLGAGLATVVVLGLIRAAGGPGALVAVSALALCAGLLFGGGWVNRWRWALRVVLVGQLAVFGWFAWAEPLRLPVPASKDLGWALRFQQVSAPEYTRWNPVARVDVMPELVVREPMIVGGVSSAWTGRDAVPPPEFPLRLVTLDGTSMTGIYRFDGDLSRFQFLDHAVIGAPYALGLAQPTVLNIGVGGGLDVLLAQRHGATRITAIELNRDVVALLRGRYADYSGRLAFAPNVDLVVAEGRSHLIRDESTYDIVQGIGLDNLAALSGGAYVLAESYLYTVEALDLALRRLTPRGVFAWTRGTYDPPREVLRLTGLAAEALRRQGVADPARHIAIVANEAGSAATLLVTRRPFLRASVERLRTWATANHFAFLHEPFQRLPGVYADYLHATDPRAFERAYPFNLDPVTDDRPYFYNYFKWTRLTADGGANRHGRYPLGNVILLTLVTLGLAAAVVFIVWPLLRYQRAGLRTPHALPMLGYFSLLGAAYIFVEIILIQRLTLFIGYPTIAVTATIFGMLTFSAFGSLTAGRIIGSARQLRVAMLALVVLLGACLIGLPAVLEALLWLPDAARLAAGIALIGPLAFLMGMPFPTGLHQLGRRAPSLVPWAMGMNGVFSVIGSSVVILVSMATSFTSALAGAAILYGLAALACGGLWHVTVEHEEGATQVPARGPAADLALGH